MAIAVASRVCGADAQIDPDDTGAGTKLGLAQESNSGQVGTVSVFGRGSRRTLVVLAIFSVPAGRVEAAVLGRGRSCTRRPRGSPRVRSLAAIRGGESRTVLPWPAARLLSGNYLVEVFAPGNPTRLSCGELHRSPNERAPTRRRRAGAERSPL